MSFSLLLSQVIIGIVSIINQLLLINNKFIITYCLCCVHHNCHGLHIFDHPLRGVSCDHHWDAGDERREGKTVEFKGIKENDFYQVNKKTFVKLKNKPKILVKSQELFKWSRSGGPGLLPSDRFQPAEPEASHHDQRLGKAAYGRFWSR